MKILSALMLLPLLTPSSAMARANAYKIDSSKSKVEFVVLRGMRVGAKGTFKNVTGTVRYSDKNISQSSITALIPIASINSGVAARDNDLKGPKYLNAGIFPQASFESQKVSKGKDGKFVVTGLFQMHGCKKLIVIRLPADPQLLRKGGVKMLSMTGFTNINQRDFGLNLLKLHPDGFVRINDVIGIKVQIEASQN
ncbi:MAG: YceI family protein [Candidatus Melainabacteria bacterium]|nr:YceI family protein [Candidatus Melainabacteria bacterium]